jgi:transposase
MDRQLLHVTEESMMARGLRLRPVILTPAERAFLLSLSRRRTSTQAIACRARIVLAAAEGMSNLAVAAALSISRLTVGKWRARFLSRRLDGLRDDPRPGAPKRITDADVARVVNKALEEPPMNAAQWSTRSLAQETGMSQSTVSRILRAFTLQRRRRHSRRPRRIVLANQ